MITLHDEEQQAQRIACVHLIKGCETAVSELQDMAREAEEQSPPSVRAGDILAQVLSSWRDALQILTVGEQSGSAPPAANLDSWTSDELFAEALTRRAADGPALRIMQGLTLQALLEAHDHQLATAPVHN